jgi:hypothetical protein
MSSSGALALALQYRKPFISSKFFAENLATDELQKLAKKNKIATDELLFDLNYSTFTKAFLNNWHNQSLSKKMTTFGRQVSKAHDWREVAEQYLTVIEQVNKQTVRATKVQKVYFWQRPAYSQAGT